VAKLRIDEGEAGFADDLRRVGTPNPSKGQLDPKAMQRGTVFHRRWEGKALATFADNFDLHIKVSRMIDNSGVRVPFALAVTLEAEDDLPIYDEVLARIDIALRPRLPAVVRA
jgi:hypothetical protein